eukprot:2082967-Prymnesium_polylepis.1
MERLEVEVKRSALLPRARAVLHDILHVFSSSLAARAVVRAEELTATCHTPSLPAIHLDRADDCK